MKKVRKLLAIALTAATLGAHRLRREGRVRYLHPDH